MNVNKDSGVKSLKRTSFIEGASTMLESSRVQFNAAKVGPFIFQSLRASNYVDPREEGLSL
jgi:hypothetical protein